VHLAAALADRLKSRMAALVSLLALVLAAPYAPPLSPTASNDAIHDEITAGDPAFTPTPAPLERLLAATKLAETRLRSAADPDAALDALVLTVSGRRAAYVRTGEGSHQCRIIAAADHVLAGDGVPPGLKVAATDFRQEARDQLGAKPCAAPPAPPVAPPVAPPGPSTAAPPVAAPPDLHPGPSPRTP